MKHAALVVSHTSRVSSSQRPPKEEDSSVEGRAWCKTGRMLASAQRLDPRIRAPNLHEKPRLDSQASTSICLSKIS